MFTGGAEMGWSPSLDVTLMSSAWLGFPGLSCLGTLASASCSLTGDSVSISRTVQGQACAWLCADKGGEARSWLMELVSGEADEPTEGCSVCDVHFTSPGKGAREDHHSSLGVTQVTHWKRLVQDQALAEGGW